MQRGFISELQRFFVILAVACVIGFASGYFLSSITVAAFGYIAWCFYNMRRMEKWLSTYTSDNVPDASGFWEEVYYQISSHRARHIKEKRRLQTLILRVQETTAALKDAVVVLDGETSIQWWNQSARRLIGLQPEDHGKPIVNFVRSPRFVRYLEEGNFNEPLTISSAIDNDLFLHFQISKYGQGEYLVVIRDVSRVQKLEQMRKDFIGNVSHELRTPLTVVRGYLETMSDNSDSLAPVWQKAIGQMSQQTKRMTLIIEDLLTLTRLETEDTQYKECAINVHDLLASIANDARDLSRDKNHRFDVDAPDHFLLTGVPEELRSCLSNLVFNAVRYSPPDSLITLKAYSDNSGFHIGVQDQGIGIEERHIPRLTERFYRVDSSRSLDTGGTGLGLAIVKHVLSRHQAQLQITSRINHGSTFTCSFETSRFSEKPPADLEEEISDIDG
ncbi:phosphate regulon sensor histidine kinase PhoR [Sessilibacter corallicola]